LILSVVTNDPANRPEASYSHHPVNDLESLDNPAEFIAGCLRDAACRWRGDLPRTVQEMKSLFFLLIDEAIKDALESGLDSHGNGESMDAITEMLNKFTQAQNGRLLAYCYLLVINRSPYPETEIAKMLGVGKAAVSKIKIQLQEDLKLNPRVGRSKEAREKFRNICLNRGKRRQPQTLWKAQTLFLQPV
jgi:hypothetical protein